MLARGRSALVLGLLLLADLLCAQTVVNSTFVGESEQPASYGEPSNWDPAGVPNNTATTRYNAVIGSLGWGRQVTVDADATISNLALGPAAHLVVFEKALTIEGVTTNKDATSISIQSFWSAAASLNAGTLSTFADKTLRGDYTILSAGPSATLQFTGADIVRLSDAHLLLEGASARIVDEAGNDALRNLSRIDPSAWLELHGRNALTSQPFTNAGRLSLVSSIFNAAGSLANFEPSTKTLAGGVFVITGGELRFPGADIVSLSSDLTLSHPAARIADTTGNDGLRNFARLLPDGRLTLSSYQLAIGGAFTNEGALSVGGDATFVVSGSLTNFDRTTRTLGGGAFTIAGGQLRFRDADVVRNAATLTVSNGGSIKDLTGGDALRNFAENLGGGVFTVGSDYRFSAAGDFTNAGTIQIAPQTFTTRQYRQAGRFTMPAGLDYTQTAGATNNDGVLTARNVNIRGGSLSGKGSIEGNVIVGSGTITPSSQMLISGNLTLEPASRFRYAFDRFGSRRSVTGSVVLGGTLELDVPREAFPARNESFHILSSSQAISGSFSNAPDGARVTTVDGSGSFRVEYDDRVIAISDFQPATPPAQLLNISTRAFLKRADADPSGTRSVIVGGFIISGFEAKTVVVRGIGPSLARFGVESTLADPTLVLHGPNGQVIATNDDWKTAQQNQIAGLGLAPSDDREAAIATTLNAGAYTVVLREKSGSEGDGLVEVYDVSRNTRAKLANISTRGFVDSEHVLIGGVIAGGDGPGNAELVVRAIGPQLKSHGVSNALEDPTLEVRSADGALVASNDDWHSNSGQPGLSGLTPVHEQESAIHLSLPHANYSAIVRPKAGASGVALVEVYDLRR